MTPEMRKLTTSIAADFAAHMSVTFSSLIIAKETSPGMSAMALGFDIARKLGAKGLPSSDAFMTTFATTIANRVYIPSAHRTNPVLFVEVVTHEHQHVVQWRDAKVRMPWLYAREPEARVKMECDAYAAGLAVRQRLTGRIVTDGDVKRIVASLIASYHLLPEDADLATDLLGSHLASLLQGIVMAEAGHEAIRWLTTHHPGLRG